MRKSRKENKKPVGQRARLSVSEQKIINDLRLDTSNRVLVIGDVHAPFGRKDYLQFCIDTYEKYRCNKVVFIGDIIDSHWSSFHVTDPDGMGGGAELELAIGQIQKWYKAFPDADVTIGNHDAIIMRKAFDSGVPAIWIKSFNDVLGTPGWRWVNDVIIDDVRYVHGHKSSKARTAAKRDMQSTVTGHYHTDMYVDWMFGAKKAVFAMAVGCGIDSDSYAMGYMAGGKKEALGCGVVLDNGQTPITVKMNLDIKD